MTFKGKWYRHIDCDDEMKDNFDKFLIEMLEHDASQVFYKSEEKDIVELRNKLSDEDVLKWIDEYVAKERVFYDDFMKDTEIAFITISKVRDDFISLCHSIVCKSNMFLCNNT